MTAPARRALAPAGRSAAVAALAVVIAALPAFLTGALAVLVRADLGFGQARLGLAVAGFFAVAGLTAVPGGRIVHRIGWRAGLLAGSLCSLVTLLAIAALATTWAHLALLLCLAGAGVALIDPAANTVLSRTVPHGWQGRAFGLKEAAIPAAALVGGASLPLVGVTVGWRWAYAGSAALVILLWLALAARAPQLAVPPPARRDGGRAPAGPVVLLAAVAGCGVGAANSLGAFLVDTAVAAGLTPSAAGVLLAGGGAAAIASRLLGGWVADRRLGSALALVAGMLAAGTAGFGALAVGRPAGVFVGTVLAFAGGWGWTGLLYYAVVRARHTDPARASGIVLAGLAGGGAAGPLAFGSLAEATSYAVAWAVAACLAALAAGLTALAARRLAA